MINKNLSSIDFPCDFVIKVVGKNTDKFEEVVLGIVKKHFPKYGNGHLNKRLSRNASYQSLTITVYAENKAQLDSLYQDLSSAPEILMAL